jgi:hypothetical protein
MLFKCIVKCGHAGCGRYTERAIYVHARNVLHAMLKAKRMGGVKKGTLMRNGGSVLAVARVSGPAPGH